MTIKECTQVYLEQLIDDEIDLLICCSGYESRAIHLSKNLSGYKIKRKVVFEFGDREDLFARKANDHYYFENQFERLNCDGDSEENIVTYLNAFVKKFENRNLTVMIDYSSMTRVWYATVLFYFKNLSQQYDSITILFSYSLSEYIESPPKQTYNIHIGPIRGFSTVSVPQKPTAVIIGLGYEKNRAMGLAQYFDGETFLFYTDGTKQPEFSAEVEKNNKEIIKSQKRENIYRYPINNLDFTYESVSSLCKDLSTDYRVILAPCGPKPFTLISLITALCLDNIDVWRISSGKEGTPIDKKAEGEVIILKISMVK